VKAEVQVEKTTTKRTAVEKMRTENIKEEAEDGEGVKLDRVLDDKDNAIKEETVVEQGVVGKAKRGLKLEARNSEDQNVSLELEGVTTLADRVKRRRRR
jgi:N-glycosylase/DNA lyase